ncbi:hypothetical protein [Ramlibacter tataouinensis]|uniref:Uncharacterized protein n=1 Tax=Ramlibacter tataouinensis (strain ATCC BAA-407 / DSM 14655 / LMG 21543 / TTB310) TaxID=365046 RepID=F5XW93_RAMTT|nr:hypothetical protein [Ramlibacter tataouinensis]AEG91663.1 Hypothetical protein Rta_05850 [Ramlibacter tataouinensis TTB310]
MSTGKAAPGPAIEGDRAALENAIDKLARRARELRAFNASAIQDRWDQRLEALQKKVNGTLADALGAGTPEYQQYAIGPLGEMDPALGDRYSPEEFQDSVRQAIARAGTKVNAVSMLLTRRLEGPAPAAPTAAAPTQAPAPRPAPAPVANPAPAPAPAFTPAPPPAPSSSPVAKAVVTPPPPPPPPRPALAPAASGGRTSGVAVVCAAGDGTGQAVAALVGQLGLTAVLRPPATGTGASLLDGLESLRGAEFAVVIPGPDADAALPLQIGFLLGAVGRNRVCLLLTTEPQSVPALDGLACHAVDSAGLWRLVLAREMRQAGLAVDMNRAL